MIYSKLLASLFRARYGRPSVVAEGEAEALVLVADGCGSPELCDLALRHVMGDSGRHHLVRPIRWGHGFGRWHADLADVANHRAWARSVADEVMAWRGRHPGVPVFLVGKSGGAGIVVGALELLPEGAVEVAVLLAPALSPGYDLAPALRAVGREMVAFWSPLDAVILGAGTWLFGTIDRVRSPGAGLVGFQATGRPGYEKLRQVRWDARMAASGHLGGHVGTDSPAFLRRYVVPLLAARSVVGGC